jgi:hypothetical protein
MAKFIDLDLDQKCTFAANLTAISVAAQMLHSAATGEFTLPSHLTIDDWVGMIYAGAHEELEARNQTVEEICQLVDNAIAQHPHDGDETIVYKITNRNLN